MDFRRVTSYVVIAAIAIIFVISFGPASPACGGEQVTAESAAAVVNGREISAMEFNRAYSQQVARMRSMGGGQLPESLLRQWVPQQVIQGLVDTELLVQAADKHGIVATDEEVARIIRSNPDFHKDGTFDQATYERVLRDFYRRTYADYERWVRQQLSAQKMRDFVESTAAVSDEEVRFRYQREGNTAELTYVRFLPSFYAAQIKDPTPRELARFQAQNEALIAAEYEKNKATYQQGEQVRARHILLKVPADAPPEKKEEIKARAASLKKEIEGGKDFAEVARNVSEDEGSKASGGDLGFNERSAWVPAFSDAAFALETGKISDPVESQFGIHLIKVEEKKPATTRTLDEVRGELAQRLYKSERAKALAKAAAEKALAQARTGKRSLADLFPPEKDNQPAALRFEQETRPEAVKTESFNASAEAVPRLGAAPELTKAVFARQEPGLIQELFPVGEGFVVANVNSRNLPSDADFEAKKEQLRQEALNVKRNELVTSYIQSLKSEGKVETNEEVISTLIGQS